MNKGFEDLVFQSGKLTISVIVRTLLIVGLGSFLGLVLWLLLLPLFSQCSLEGAALVKCSILLAGVLFLAFVSPFLFFWFGKNYALKKTLHSFYQHYKKPVLLMCAEKACTHRQKIVEAHKFKSSKFFAELPLMVRLVLSRIDLSFLVAILQKNPNITPLELERNLEFHIDEKSLVEKPSLAFFGWLLFLMLSVFFGLKWWF